jgi:Rieske Fe-S protein
MNTRREFLTGLGKIAGGVVLTQISLPFLESCTPTSVPLVPPPVTSSGTATIDVSDLSDANPAKVIPGIIGPDGFSIMVTRTSDGTFHALSMRCTHANCPVDARLYPDPKLHITGVHCNCHDSLYALDGMVIRAAGPNQPPLSSYTVTYDQTAKVVHVKIA